MPENILEKWKRSIPGTWKVCFFSALLVGLLAHIYKITNWLPNWDSLVFRYDAQNMLGLGRWFLGVVCAPGSFYDLPWLSGFFAIVFHALGAVCIVAMFDVKKNITAALLAAVTVSFPTVTSVMMYNYVADGYAISFFLACLATLFLTMTKPRYLLSVVCIMLSVAIYQAYITVTVMLVLVFLTDALLFGKKDARALGKQTLIVAGTGLCGMVLYYLVLLLLLRLTGAALLDYQGVSASVSVEMLDIHTSFYVIYKSFMGFFFNFSAGASVFSILNCVVFGLLIVFGIVGAVRAKVFTKPGKLLLLCLYVLLMPIGANLLALINAHIDYHNLMKMGYCVFYIFFILFYERLHLKGRKRMQCKVWCVLGISLCLIANQVVLANVSYHKAQIAYEKSYGVLMRLADRIEQTAGATDCEKLLVIGALEGSAPYSADLPPEMTGITDGYILRADDENVNQSVVCSAINDYCGTSYAFLYGAEKASFLKKSEVQAMQVWPAATSVAVVDGVLVLKLGTERK